MDLYMRDSLAVLKRFKEGFERETIEDLDFPNSSQRRVFTAHFSKDYLESVKIKYGLKNVPSEGGVGFSCVPGLHIDNPSSKIKLAAVRKNDSLFLCLDCKATAQALNDIAVFTFFRPKSTVGWARKVASKGMTQLVLDECKKRGIFENVRIEYDTRERWWFSYPDTVKKLFDVPFADAYIPIIGVKGSRVYYSLESNYDSIVRRNMYLDLDFLFKGNLSAIDDKVYLMHNFMRIALPALFVEKGNEVPKKSLLVE